MKADFQLLELLADGQYHSGESLAEFFSLSRAAIWKKINLLRSVGIEINAVKGKGYQLKRPIEALDNKIIYRAIPSNIREKVNQVTVLHEIDSTNNFLLDKINHDDFHAHAVITEFQTKGRGRRGNSWLSPYAAGLYLSMGWHFQSPVETTGIISLATGVAIIKSLQQAGINDAMLKWPNDILYEGKKLGGILVEMRLESSGPCYVVIGAGINYAMPEACRKSIEQPCVDLLTIDESIDSRNKLAGLLIAEITEMLLNLQTSSMSEIIHDWRAYDGMTGKKATLLLPDKTLQGRVSGIDDEGALLFTIGKATKRFHSGEISLRSHVEITD